LAIDALKVGAVKKVVGPRAGREAVRVARQEGQLSERRASGGDYGKCPQNIASLFNGYVVYELPFGHGRRYASGVNNALNYVIGGWRVSSSFVFHSGFAQTVFASSDTSGTGGFSTRPNCVKGVSSHVPMTFDPSTGGVT
jgi:hypothetical protein